MITIYSSHGELKVDRGTGRVDHGVSVFYKPESNELRNILRFDIEEFCVFWGTTPRDADILDVGYWIDTGEYEPPAMDWRFETAFDFVLQDMQDDGHSIPESLSLAEVSEIRDAQFGAVAKQ